jgi:glucosamine--fructose-6-phosphate aminotransferase (isomerizing)
MCGIIGFFGYNESCYLYLLKGLQQLQNRGYDSAGMCSICEKKKKFEMTKFASIKDEMAVKKLEGKEVEEVHFNNKIGIAHTRWATHGVINDVNSHPHISSGGIFSIVHNGIIENYEKIKDFLIGERYKFSSETDTEVAVNLLEYEYAREKNVVNAIQNMINKLEGTYGFVILCKETPNKMYCVKKGSPLLVSVNDKFAIVASEKNGFDNKVKDYKVLKSKDVCIISKINGKIKLETKNIYKTNSIQECHSEDLTHDTWTLQEIMEQKCTIYRAMGNGGRFKSESEVRLGGLEMCKYDLKKCENIILLGCGSSYHAGSIGSYYFRDLCDLNSVQVFDGADFHSKHICKSGETVIILLSQSGETHDLYRCIEIGRKNNCLLVGVVNVVDSMIAREVDCGCYLNAGREIAVGSTKSFTSQVVVLSLIAIYISNIKNPNFSNKRVKYISDLRSLQQDFIETLENCETLCEKMANLLPPEGGSCFIVGKESSEAVAKEGSLKLKELSYIHAEGFSTSSLKHGPFALLTEGFLVIILAPKNNQNYKKIKNAYHEIKSRKATIICITDDDSFDCENKIPIPSNKTFQDLLCVLPLQLLTYYLAKKNGINPDFPRNLAKVVTVE